MTTAVQVPEALMALLQDFPKLRSRLAECPPPLVERILRYAGELRGFSMLVTILLAKSIGATRVVETGTLRRPDSPDGQSTKIFAEYARWVGGKFYSVDISSEAIAVSKQEVGEELLPYVQYVCEDSVSWLSRFQDSIDLLYLDSYDFDESDPGPAQWHELAELGAAYGKLSNPALILLDDCAVAFEGKGYLGTRFLKNRGWKLVLDGYQRLFFNYKES